MTTESAAPVTVPFLGELLAAEDLAAGQYIYIAPLSRSGRDWCEVRGVARGRKYLRLDVTRRDGQEFWYRLPPRSVLRVLHAPPPPSVSQSDVVRAELQHAFPKASFRVRASGGAVRVAWIDGPSSSAVLSRLASAGAAHLDCRRTVSAQLTAAAVVRQAREGSLADYDRHRTLVDRDGDFSDDEHRLARQLLAFSGEEGWSDLSLDVLTFGLPLLAETAGVPCPAPVLVCPHCYDTPEFEVRYRLESASRLSCGKCLNRFTEGRNHEIVPMTGRPTPSNPGG